MYIYIYYVHTVYIYRYRYRYIDIDIHIYITGPGAPRTLAWLPHAELNSLGGVMLAMGEEISICNYLSLYIDR